MSRESFKIPWRTNEPLALRADALAWDYWRGNEATTHKEDETVPQGVAVVEIRGGLSLHPSWWGDSYDDVISCVTNAYADGAHTVVLDIDSPGGEAAGCVEAGRELRRIATEAGGRLIAFANAIAYSAAYALAVAADHVAVLPSGGAASVGCIAGLASFAKMNERVGVDVALVRSGAKKCTGHPDEPIDPDAVAALQAAVDETATKFGTFVAERRGLSLETVLGFEGEAMTATKALATGMVDSLATYSQVMQLAGDRESLQTKENLMKIRSNAAGKPATAATSAKAKEKAKLAAAIAAAKSALAAVSAEAENQEQVDELQKTVDDLAKRVAELEGGEGETTTDDDAAAEDDKDETAAEDGDDTEAEDEDGEPEATARTGNDLVAQVKRVLGVSTIAAASGALLATVANARKSAKLRASNAKLRSQLAAAKRDSTVSALVDGALREGRITPAQRASMVAMGNDSTEALSGFLASCPPRIRTLDDGPSVAAAAEQEAAQRANGGGEIALTADEKERAKRIGVTEAAMLTTKIKHIEAGTFTGPRR